MANRPKRGGGGGSGQGGRLLASYLGDLGDSAAQPETELVGVEGPIMPEQSQAGFSLGAQQRVKRGGTAQNVFSGGRLRANEAAQETRFQTAAAARQNALVDNALQNAEQLRYHNLTRDSDTKALQLARDKEDADIGQSIWLQQQGYKGTTAEQMPDLSSIPADYFRKVGSQHRIQAKVIPQSLAIEEGSNDLATIRSPEGQAGRRGSYLATQERPGLLNESTRAGTNATNQQTDFNTVANPTRLGLLDQEMGGALRRKSFEQQLMPLQISEREQNLAQQNEEHNSFANRTRRSSISLSPNNVLLDESGVQRTASPHTDPTTTLVKGKPVQIPGQPARASIYNPPQRVGVHGNINDGQIQDGSQFQPAPVVRPQPINRGLIPSIGRGIGNTVAPVGRAIFDQPNTGAALNSTYNYLFDNPDTGGAGTFQPPMTEEEAELLRQQMEARRKVRQIGY